MYMFARLHMCLFACRCVLRWLCFAYYRAFLHDTLTTMLRLKQYSVSFFFQCLSQGIIPRGPFQIAENSNNAFITTLQTIDEDKGDNHSYSLPRNPGNKFRMDGSQLMTNAMANLDYEQQPVYNVTIVSTDSGSPPKFIESGFIINVLDSNEMPTSVSLSKNSVSWAVMRQSPDDDDFKHKSQKMLLSIGHMLHIWLPVAICVPSFYAPACGIIIGLLLLLLPLIGDAILFNNLQMFCRLTLVTPLCRSSSMKMPHLAPSLVNWPLKIQTTSRASCKPSLTLWWTQLRVDSTFVEIVSR